MLHAIVAEPHHLVELAVLVLANLVATAVRFVLLRGWVFHPRRRRTDSTDDTKESIMTLTADVRHRYGRPP